MSNPFTKPAASSVSSRFVAAADLPSTSSAPSEEYDPRSLYERIKAQKDAKTEKYDEMFKLSNQFRGLDEGETTFLADVDRQNREAERAKSEAELKELQHFRKARATSPPVAPTLLLGPRVAASPPTATAPTKSAKQTTNTMPTATASATAGTTANKKRKKAGTMLGVVRKKSSSTAPPSSSSPEKANATPAASPSAAATTTTTTAQPDDSSAPATPSSPSTKALPVSSAKDGSTSGYGKDVNAGHDSSEEGESPSTTAKRIKS